MKREIKFRVWDNIKKRMIIHEQDFIPLKITNWGVLKLSPNYEESLYEFVKPADGSEWEMMQYTGLEDKNEKEIYEKDVCRIFNIKMQEYEIGVVKMSGLGCWSFKIGNLLIPIHEFIDSQLSIVHDFSRIEIIGNIYENPELIERPKTDQND